MGKTNPNQNLFQFKARLLLIENYAMTQIISINKLEHDMTQRTEGGWHTCRLVELNSLNHLRSLVKIRPLEASS